jgi:hypothetical protein
MLFNEYYFTETLSNELKYLQTYLELSKIDKAINRAYQTPYLIQKYLKNENKMQDIFKDMEDYEIIEWLSENDKQTLIDYGEYIVGQSEYYNTSEAQLYDVANYLSFIRQQWLVHFSDQANLIVHDQAFKFGVPYEDYERLALSTHFKNIAKGGGFNFAYTVDDVKKYAFERGRPKYGLEAVLFKGDGLKIWHSGDEEKQVIFDGKSTTSPLIYLQFDNGMWHIDSTQTGKKLIQSEKIIDICNWVDLNYAQYHKHLEV